MKLNMWEVMAIVILWWICATCHNYLDWQWQANYDKMIQSQFEMDTR